MRILVTGGGGFIGSHIVEYYARKGDEVTAVDNLSRQKLLGRQGKITYNWHFIKRLENVWTRIVDVTNFEQLSVLFDDVDVIFHTAAQTAVTTSLTDPMTDFKTNALGTLNVLEAARRCNSNPTVIICSTNKVYGNNVNKVKLLEKSTRYEFAGKYRFGIPEDFPIDLTGHSPYGCSKLYGDLCAQDYAHTYGMKTGIFRMSCIMGTRQFGVEDQGWVAWFTIATLTGKPITIYGDGKQVRDVLYVTDLVRAFDAFSKRSKAFAGEVFNIGGGPENTLSLIELLNLIGELTGRFNKIQYTNWRPSDQKVYISDISKAKEKLGWTPKVSPKDGVKKLVDWVLENRRLFD